MGISLDVYARQPAVDYLHNESLGKIGMSSFRKAANANNDASDCAATAVTAHNPRLLEWLSKLTQQGFSLDMLNQPLDRQEKANATGDDSKASHSDDWAAVGHVCGYSPQCLIEAAVSLPLTAAEIDFFRRNHRGTENHISRDFLTAQTDLPSPLAELYGLYRHRARIDAEAALFLAQSTGSTRVARVMADLLAIGAFANAFEGISHMGATYSVSSAFDTSADIDRANMEATRLLALPSDHPSHLLKATPDELGVIATSIAGVNATKSETFLEKAQVLSVSRQDVNRLPENRHFATAINERDVPLQKPWGARLAVAYARIFPLWVAGSPEVQALLA